MMSSKRILSLWLLFLASFVDFSVSDHFDDDSDPNCTTNTTYTVKCSSYDEAQWVMFDINKRETVYFTQVYYNIFYGFSVFGLSEDLVFALQNDNRVIDISESTDLYLAATQRNPGWNLDRIDQDSSEVNRQYKYNAMGRDVQVFVLDSGIHTDHKQFKTGLRASRVTNGFCAFEDQDFTDYLGHGTAVASIIGGKKLGVAKSVRLVSVKVFDDYVSSSSDVLAGMDYVISQKQKFPKKPMIMNLSFNGPPNSLIDEAVSAAVKKGIFVVIAAGNNGDDACNYSPASVASLIERAGVLTVGATQGGDYKSLNSNSGKCVDLFAPGLQIYAACSDDTSCIAINHGTSLAAAHVSGVAAQILQKVPLASPATIKQRMLASAQKDVVQHFYGSNLLDETPNRLLHTEMGEKLSSKKSWFQKLLQLFGI